ncbi:Uma2 family endonuclease [Streptomyces oryzae]|uniref:Uma2 family endonuclease n=1 Tax=Streptomyces oryzae TaxID=1434886 RepID=A0ABS3XK77_9ACTN|nr:Uma2 family endonuclease [Streptomyces oryzae]MBO8195807.1 Uma2 family endonuclease [Streptomyces oryzae]
MTVMLERSTAIETPDEPDGSFDALLGTLLAMDVPEGFRAEIIGGNIVMSPWSKGYYLRATRSLRAQLEPHVPTGTIVDSSPYLFTFPDQERAFGPDVFVASEKAFDTDARYIDGEALVLVAGLTSASTRNVDWSDKLSVYAKAGVAVYLLLDMQAQTVSVFSDPAPEGYWMRRTCQFGKALRLPPPFDFELGTSTFGKPSEGEG